MLESVVPKDKNRILYCNWLYPYVTCCQGTQAFLCRLLSHPLFTHYLCVTDFPQPVPPNGSTNAVPCVMSVLMHVKDPWLSLRVGHHVSLAGFCLSLYSLHMLKRDVYMIQINKQRNKSYKSDLNQGHHTNVQG